METVVLIPAYNEEKNIKQIVTRTRKLGYAVLVIDDSSEDKTFGIAKKAGAIAIRHQTNKGKGEGIKTGFNYIFKNLDAKYIVLIDADLQYIPEDIPVLVNKLREANVDFVMGYRNWSVVPFRHKFGNIVWRLFFNLLFGTRLKDTNCGFMAMKTGTAKKIKDIHGGYIIENHILSQLVKSHLKIRQVPVSIYYRHKSKTIRGLKMVLGVLVFIITEGVKYRLHVSRRA